MIGDSLEPAEVFFCANRGYLGEVLLLDCKAALISVCVFVCVNMSPLPFAGDQN